MQEPLLDKIKEGMPEWKISVLKNLLFLIDCLFHKETLNLYKWRGALGVVTTKKATQPSSHYKRATRFFTNHAFSRLWLAILLLGFRLLRLRVDYLLLDGSSWEHGDRKLHLLTLCVRYQNVAIPIYWEDLSKKGTSSYQERKDLFKRAMRRLNLQGKKLLADREYLGEDWFKFLVENGIDFTIRSKRKCYKKAIDQAGGLRYSALEAKLLRSKKVGKAVYKDFCWNGLPLRLVMVKNLERKDKDAIIYLISTTKISVNKISREYFLRWKIECCFKHMKSSGFDMETINLPCKCKTKLLLAMTVFAYILSILEGLKEYGKVPTKKYADGTQTKTVAVFREGIDWLVAKCPNFNELCKYICKEIKKANNSFRSPKAIVVQ